MFLRRWTCWLAGHMELGLAAVLSLAAAALWAFVALAEAVTEGETHAFDRAVLACPAHGRKPGRPARPALGRGDGARRRLRSAA